MKKPSPEEIVKRCHRAKFLLTDCDGVLTDAGVYYSDAGETFKKFNIRDGLGVERLRKERGIETGIISGERSGSLKKRAEKLLIKECHLGIEDKAAVLVEIAKRHKLLIEEIAYIGDDVNDLSIFDKVGLTACPADAMPLVKESVDIICNLPGGKGAFREFAETILSAYDEESGP